MAGVTRSTNAWKRVYRSSGSRAAGLPSGRTRVQQSTVTSLRSPAPRLPGGVGSGVAVAAASGATGAVLDRNAGARIRLEAGAGAGGVSSPTVTGATKRYP